MASGASQWILRSEVESRRSEVGGRRSDMIAEKIGELLREKNWTLAVAESCTGGLIGHTITTISGSSEYFLGGI
ncbi:MAG: CinA family protein, partial [Kiritimatiellae bacterium]|nr:CinA family protein [Kiritimatiellia bacterium]